MSTHAAVEPEPSLSQFLQQQDLDKVKHFILGGRRYNMRCGNSRQSAIVHVGLAMSEEHMYTPFLEIFVYHADDEVTVHLVPNKQLPESLCYHTKIKSAVTSNVVNTVLGLLRSLPSKGRYRTCLEELVHLQPEPATSAAEPDSGISGVFAHLHRQLPRAEKAIRVRTGVEEYPVAYLYTIPTKDGCVRVHLERPRGNLGYLYMADLTEDNAFVRLERAAHNSIVAVFAAARSAEDLARKLAVAAATNHSRKRVQAAAEPQHRLSAFDFAAGLHKQMRDGAPVRIGKRLFLMFSSRRENRDFVQLHFQIPGDPGEVRVHIHENDVAQTTVYIPPRIGRLCSNVRAHDLEHGPAPVMLKKFLTGLKINCNTDQFGDYDNVYELLEKLPGLSMSVEAAAEPAQDPRETLCEKLKSKYDLELDPKLITYMGKDGIDYDGIVNWSGKNLTGIPVRFRKVTGTFACHNNNLTSLENAPVRVDNGSFYCSANKLTSLKHAPAHVDDHFFCSGNLLSSLDHAPVYVGGNIYCGNNRLPGKTKKPAGVRGSLVREQKTTWSIFGAAEPGVRVDYVREALRQLARDNDVKTTSIKSAGVDVVATITLLAEEIDEDGTGSKPLQIVFTVSASEISVRAGSWKGTAPVPATAAEMRYMFVDTFHAVIDFVKNGRSRATSVMHQSRERAQAKLSKMFRGGTGLISIYVVELQEPS